MTMGNPSRSTTTTETLKPMLSHLVSAALAMVCAIASGIFFWVTSPCAPAADDSTAATAKLARPFEIGNMGYPFGYFVDTAAPSSLDAEATSLDGSCGVSSTTPA